VGTIVPLLGTIFKARFVFVLFKLDPRGAAQFFRFFFLPEFSSPLAFQFFWDPSIKTMTVSLHRVRGKSFEAILEDKKPNPP
jgi:hypothetical protein